MWDQHNKFTGPYLEGHTNVTEIEQGLDLLWRNGVKPNQVVMGFAFYGRSFTMSNPGCSKPGCTFSTSGQPGSCTITGGILSYSEVASRNSSLDVHTFYDQKSTVKYNVFNGNQWISYDDEQSFLDKKKYLTSRCLGGLMIWAIDQDTQNHDALSGLLGDFSGSQLEGGNIDDKTAAALSDAFGAFTGQNCFVTPTCTDGTDGQKQKDQICPPVLCQSQRLIHRCKHQATNFTGLVMKDGSDIFVAPRKQCLRTVNGTERLCGASLVAAALAPRRNSSSTKTTMWMIKV